MKKVDKNVANVKESKQLDYVSEVVEKPQDADSVENVVISKGETNRAYKTGKSIAAKRGKSGS